MSAHLLELRRTAFVLWRPHDAAAPPRLIVGRFQAGNPPGLADRREVALSLVDGHSDLWSVSAAACGLSEGEVSHYWFEVTDSHPFRDGRRVLVTDPVAFTVDWRLLAPRLPPPYDVDDQDPAAVVTFVSGELVACDAAGETFSPAPPIAPQHARPNHRMVIYELPTSWTRTNVHGDPQVGVGTFRDVLALVDRQCDGENFCGVAALAPGRAHLEQLGVSALELLPVADSFVDREWGYATSNYFAPDHDLGFPDGHSSPTANTDLIALVAACHDAASVSSPTS
jgi:pullulanase